MAATGGSAFWFLPLTLAAAAGRSFAALSEDAARGWSRDAPQARSDIAWATANAIVAETATMRLRRFDPPARTDRRRKRPSGRPIFVEGPYALHDTGLADLAPGHSLVASLLETGRPVFLTEWLNATTQMAHCSIDTYLADLSVAVDIVGPPIDLIGLCQGGWMALVLAALFPHKVARCVIVGAPVDMHAGGTGIAPIAACTPPQVVQEMISIGGGVMPGTRLLDAWMQEPGDRRAACEALQLTPPLDAEGEAAQALFATWYHRPLDLPGVYFMQVYDWLFRENRLALGRLHAFGRTVDLRAMTAPLMIVAGADDLVAPAAQVVAAADLVGTRPRDIETHIVPGCGHLQLYMGGRVLNDVWPRIAAFLDRPT